MAGVGLDLPCCWNSNNNKKRDVRRELPKHNIEIYIKPVDVVTVHSTYEARRLAARKLFDLCCSQTLSPKSPEKTQHEGG